MPARSLDVSLLNVLTLFHLVPIGESNAASARMIWELEKIWSPASFKTKLNQLAAEGQIERKVVQQGNNIKVLYFRKP